MVVGEFAVELHVAFGRGVRWPLRDSDRLEVWTADHYCLGEISGALVRQLISQYLGALELHALFDHQMRTSNAKLDAAIRKPLARASPPRRPGTKRERAWRRQRGPKRAPVSERRTA